MSQTQMSQTQRNLEKYIRQANVAGCPPDQIALFVRAGYIAQPIQLKFHALARLCDESDGPFWVGVGGARGVSKSHMVLAQMGLDDCQRYPGLKLLYLRKIQKSAGESLADLTNRVFGGIEHKFTSHPGRVAFPNGSRIEIGGYKNEGDIDKYLGIEFDGLGLEESTQLSEHKITLLRGSIRSTRPEYRTRIYNSTNPGGIGHLWYVENFVKPAKEGREHYFLGGLTRFIQGTYRDNVFLKQNYIDYLEALRGPLGEAWREGNWDAFEGMAFPNWSEERHVIQPFELPQYWPKWRAVDWGSAKPFCCLWMTKNLDSGRLYVYRELYRAGLSDRQQARMIKELTPPAEKISFTYADPAMWAKKTWRGLVSSTADEYLENGVLLTQADNDRIGGKRKVDRLLAALPDGKPGMQIFDTCPNLTRTLPALPYAKTGSGQLKEDVDTNAEDHAFDALKYGLTNTDIQMEPDSKPIQQSPLQELISVSKRL